MPLNGNRLLACILLCGWGGITSLNSETIRVVGSDSVGRILSLESSEVDKSLTVSYQMSGSLGGLIKLREGYADIAFVLQTSEGYPGMDGLTAIPLGYWSLIVAVKEDNPLIELSLKEMQQLFEKTNDGLKTEWGMLLPDEPKWSHRSIFFTVDVGADDPSYPLFVEEFFEGERPQKLSSFGDKLDNPYLAGPSNLLIMSRLPEPEKELRTVALIEDGKEFGYPPTSENLHFGDYPLRTSLFMVIRDKKSEQTRSYLRSFFGSGRLESLYASGLIPVPENVRNLALLEFDLEF